MRIGRRGAIPIPYIIAIIFGVVVLALVTYWLFFTESEFGNIVKEKICEGKMNRYCSDWRFSGVKPTHADSAITSYEFSASCTTIAQADPTTTAFYAPDCCSTSLGRSLSADDCGVT